MKEPVTAILQARAAERDGMARMLTVSVAAHAGLIALLIFWPASWRLGARADENRVVMTISLGGAPGPRAGGMTPMGGRPIQQIAPLPAVRRPEPVRPPAAKPPEMTMPARAAAPKPPPKPQVPQTFEQARGRTPTKGDEIRPGSAVAETGGRGMAFGLTTGGGGAGGYLDVGNFCCPEYLSTMLDLIRRNWENRQEVTGQAQVKFTIQRDGRIVAIEVERSSGFVALDLAAQRAVAVTRQLPPLPGAFTERSLTVHLIFEYQP